MNEVSVKVLYTAHATAVGGRNGHTRSDDGLVNVDLSVPRSMGGPGKPATSTPEDLFAAGYAACFGSACDFIAVRRKLKPDSLEVHCAVSIGNLPNGSFGLKVAMTVKLSGLTEADAGDLVAAAHEICPYSKAIKGNVDVDLDVILA